MNTKLQLRALLFFQYVLVSALGQNFLSCNATSSVHSAYRCNENGLRDYCRTFAIIRTNSHFSSRSSLSSYLGINHIEVNDTEFLSIDQSSFIPIDCKCTGGFFEAEVNTIISKGESFDAIAESLEGLTTCQAIQEKNPSVSPIGAEEKFHLVVPLKCACPSSVELEQRKFLFTYPVREGDTLANLAFKFNITHQSIVSANNITRADFTPASLLEPLSTVLIPVEGNPILGSLAKSGEPSLGYPAASIRVRNSHKKRKPKMWKIGVCIAVSLFAFAASVVAIRAAFVYWKKKKKRQDSIKKVNRDLEMQQLSLSVRTTSDKKVSFEESQCALDDQAIDTTPHKRLVESYTIEEIHKATEDFNLNNLIEGSVFHARLKGKNTVIKRIPSETVSRIDIGLFYDAIYHHPNIIRILGTCVIDGSDSSIIFEYAKNGSLKDWLHGGLAMKSHFIASCNCFLSWNQRLKICLDVATALQYMHHIMNPSYVHRNIKSRNIFLDEEFNAKVGNFGMARCVSNDAEDSESFCSQPAAWNKAYLAPECLQDGVISPSVDIFAYGIVLLEVLSGQTPITKDDEKGEGYIQLSDKIKLVLQSKDAEELREWVDSALGENYSFDAVIALANLARSCIDDDPSSRPNAGEIVEKLLRLVEELPEGKQSNICESSCKPLVKAGAANNM
ncbi:protein LYK2 [Olea europaea var. sylvestris]|uniref:protein LYK2 n=1 Tax=Olea europaea var. sylvestris TaxID=158386 RepID=UPI000C1D141F|nr:protein LYK2 [Olea europaea var. sylvestris]